MADPQQTVPQRLEQLEQMRAGLAFKFPVKLRQFEVTLRPLTNIEIHAVYRAVLARMKEFGPQQTRIDEDFVLAFETLIRASSDDDGKNPQLTDYILNRMTHSELLFVYREYLGICDRCSPMFDMMTKAEVNELVDALKKNRDLASELTWRQLRSITELILLTPDSLPDSAPG